MANYFFFLEHAGELRIIVLIEEGWSHTERPPHTPTHTQRISEYGNIELPNEAFQLDNRGLMSILASIKLQLANCCDIIQFYEIDF